VSIGFGIRSVRIWRCAGAPARAIQELAGHQDLITTQRHMHLSPAAIVVAIQLLDAAGVHRSGNMVAMETSETANGSVECLSWRAVWDAFATGLPFDSLRSLRAFSLRNSSP
jgi:hypothetical protein